jgi:hypothetical protein
MCAVASSVSVSCRRCQDMARSRKTTRRGRGTLCDRNANPETRHASERARGISGGVQSLSCFPALIRLDICGHVPSRGRHRLRPSQEAGDGCVSAIGHFICQGLIGAVPGRTTFQHNLRWCLARTKLHAKEETYATRWHVHALYMSIARAAYSPHVEISMR